MAFDYFLRIDGIPGESSDSKHKGEIPVQSFSWGESQTASSPSGGGGGAGKVSIEDLHVTAPTSKAAPLLLLACASGQHIKSAVLTGRKPGKAQQEFLTLSFTDVLISDYHISSSEAQPTDSVSLRFATIEIAYREQLPDGSLGAPITAGWNVKTNTKL